MNPAGEPGSRLYPAVDEFSAPFYRAAATHQLAVPFCSACGRACWTPRAMCPRCHAVEFEWTRVAPTGTVWSYCVVHPPVIAELQARTPFVVAVVALDEIPAVRMIGDLAVRSPDQVAIGLAVNAVFETYDEAVGVVHWEPLDQEVQPP